VTRIRLLKVIVQPVFVVDDGERLIEQVAEPVTVNPTDWPTFATTTFVEGMAALQAQLDAQDANGPEPPPAARA
jgi:hypothetical protein